MTLSKFLNIIWIISKQATSANKAKPFFRTITFYQLVTMCFFSSDQILKCSKTLKIVVVYYIGLLKSDIQKVSKISSSFNYESKKFYWRSVHNKYIHAAWIQKQTQCLSHSAKNLFCFILLTFSHVPDAFIQASIKEEEFNILPSTKVTKLSLKLKYTHDTGAFI